MKDKLRLFFVVISELSDWLSSDPIIKAIAHSELYSLCNASQEDFSG